MELKAAEVRRELAEKLPRLAKPQNIESGRRAGEKNDCAVAEAPSQAIATKHESPQPMNPSTCQSLKRGWPAQQPRREAERDARLHAVAFDHWAMQQGVRQRAAARQLGLAPGTLAFWEHRWHDGLPGGPPLGPSLSSQPAAAPQPGHRFHACRGAGRQRGRRAGHLPGLGPPRGREPPRSLPAPLETGPPAGDPRSPLASPGSGVGHGPCRAAAQAIDGRWPYLLAVRDLASGCQLAWLPVLDETAETTIDALQWLFLEHGPPLVLKSDNGSGFIAEAMRRFLDRWQVRPLFSPPYTPEYNGAIEAGNGALKTRTHDEAARQGRNGHWTADDTEAARRMANELIYPHGPLGPTRQECFRTSPRISLEARAAFGRTVAHEQTQERLKQGYPLDTDLGHAAQAQIDRVAIGRALVEHGYLTFTRRSITPSIKSQKSLKIS